MTRQIEVLLSMQRALWQRITPDLRGVAVSWADNQVRALFWYDREMTEGDLDHVSCAETEVMADFLPDVRVSFVAEHLPAPAELTLPGEGDWAWVMLRCED